MLFTRRTLVLSSLATPLLARAAFAAGMPADAGTAAHPLRVGVTSGVHAQVLERVQGVLAPKGLVIKIIEFGDFIQPNAALAGGDIDVNVYQHRPFLEQQQRDRGYKFAVAGRTVLTAMAVFSKKVKHVADLPVGARVAIPNDPTNGGRALLLLQDAGFFRLTPGADVRASVADIVENPKKFRIVELDAAQIARSLDDVDAAAITGNYAVPAGLDPLHDSLAVEKGDSAYCCLVVARAGDEGKSSITTLASGYADPALKQWVLDTFKGAVIPGA
ncbi:MetQ/NlpA family ABC transporter substrate-binding protein [Acidisphaera sp. L21]|jgi:D-methionine transport system substrate-binding protein|uniref:MetQ/NlpA family ABC transporter substrate-binding protein n=1 Tax=Acidisphaera sp. L21 TaxID=1641851 RepID=UPI00131A63BE|nr:MetQ/NlpA family ABC transporter substrate-binding protein [Acidisphaera sp. L21]